MTMYRADTRTADHISDEAVALFRDLLSKQLVDHADLAAERRLTFDQLTGQVDSDSVIEREIAEVSAAHYDSVGHQTREALRRIDEGIYGLCRQCSTPIPFARLEAIPHARFCVGCSAPAGLIG